MKLLNRKQKQDKNLSKQTHKKHNKPGHARIQSFDAYFNDVMRRKNNQFALIDAPHLNEQISDLTPAFTDNYISSMSTPQHRPYRHLERKKFIDIKERIVKSVLQFQSCGISTLQEIFKIKQLMLNEFLNDFTDQIQKECKQKGEILKYIWNSMFGMIEHIAQQLGRVMQQQEREGLNKQLDNHKTYQNLIDVFKKKQTHLNEKYIQQKKTITKLVYELRFKRKQIAKLYKNQKLLLNKLNQIKHDNLNMQNSYIDLMSTVRDLPTESVEQLLRAREQINRSRQKKFKILGNKKVNRIQITKELNNDSQQQLQELFQEIKDIAADDVNSPHIISTLIQAAIQNFGIKNDDNKVNEYRIIEVDDRKHNMDAQTQITEHMFKNPDKNHQITQFSYTEKLKDSMLDNKMTQTYCEFAKKKKLRECEVQTQKEFFTKKYVQEHFKIRKVFEQRLWFAFYKQKEPLLNINHLNLNRSTKKHMSQANMYIARNAAEIYLTKNNDEAKVNQTQELPKQEVKKIQNTLVQSREVVDKALNERTKEHSIKKKIKKSSLASNITNKKHESIIQPKPPSRQSQIIQQFKKTDPSSNMKYSRFRDRTSQISRSSSQQIKIKQIRNSKQNPGNGNYTKLRDQFTNHHFLEKGNCFNIEINQQKQKFISNFFAKRDDNFCFDLDELSSQDSDLDDKQNMQNDEITQSLNYIDTMPARQSKKKAARTSEAQIRQKRASMQAKCNDENDLLMSLCRNKYYKNVKKAKGRGSILKYKDEFTCVKDKIQMIVRDVDDLITHKESLLKKNLNHKNVKNTYKILMMTLAKAYDCYNKGIPITNLVHPLFETFSLIYGAINSAEVYKKMINFIACLSISTDNTILRFFLFLLGLDKKSPYSGKLTISQVYLCLTLLQKISVDGKVTLNIQSICTDVNKVKDQLVAILKEQKIPNQLIGNIKKRVDDQLLNSAALREVDQNDAHLKINIYSIILLVIQEVIKCKNHLMQSFSPIFTCFEGDYEEKKIPTALLQTILSMCKQDQILQYKLDKIIKSIKKSTKAQSMTYEQFCSILFENNIISFNQMMKRYHYIKGKWRIPSIFFQEMKQKSKNTTFLESLELFEINFVLRLQKNMTRQVQDAHTSIQKMKKLLFLKFYQKKIKQLTNEVIGDNIAFLMQ